MDILGHEVTPNKCKKMEDTPYILSEVLPNSGFTFFILATLMLFLEILNIKSFRIVFLVSEVLILVVP
jgi:hypothetical protein